jgi:lipopolysaccharide transport system permease protein
MNHAAVSSVRRDGPQEHPSSEQKPLLEVAGGPGGVSRESLKELWLYREVLYAFAARQVKVKYKQAAVGVGWVVIQPVAAAAIFALFLGRLSDVASEGAPYFLFALAGMAAWTYFSGAAAIAMDSLVTDQALLRKVYFPREVLPLAAVGAGLVDFLPALGTLLVAALLYGYLPAVSWIALPLPVVVLAVTAAAFGLSISGLNVYYRDVRYTLPFVLQLGLFATPVVYSLSAIPEQWQDAYAILNPIAAAIDALREIVIHRSWPDFPVTFAALGWALVLTFGGYFLFKRLERSFSDRV